MGSLSRARFQILAWFLRRPRYYRQFPRVAAGAVARRLPGASRRADQARRTSEAWCRAHVIDVREAIELATSRADYESIHDLYPAELEQGEHRASTVPFYMGGAANLELIFQLSEGLQATRALETGVGYGWSSLALLLSLARRPGGSLVSTDFPYLFPESERYVGIVVPDDLRDRWTLIRDADREALPRALRLLPELDLCHYDSDKSYKGRTWAYGLLWNALRPGGILISDDIGDNTAFRDFAAAVGEDPIVVLSPPGERYAGALVKSASSA